LIELIAATLVGIAGLIAFTVSIGEMNVKDRGLGALSAKKREDAFAIEQTHSRETISRANDLVELSKYDKGKLDSLYTHLEQKLSGNEEGIKELNEAYGVAQQKIDIYNLKHK